MTSSKTHNLLIASYLEPEFVRQIQALDSSLNVFYEPDLLLKPRYISDHVGAGPEKTPEQKKRWLELLSEAEIMFDFDRAHMADLPELAPRLRWLQATSTGIGQAVHRFRYAEKMPDTIFTTASGVHARPLAEFVIMAMLMHYKQAHRMMSEQQCKSWGRFTGSDLAGRTIGIFGLGNIGSEVARSAKFFGMRTLGSDVLDKSNVVDTYYPVSEWREMLPQLDVLVLSVPHTPKTEKLVMGEEIALLRPDAFFINIARGTIVDEPALVEALDSGRLSGAALDVFEEEPLPQDSPLWQMPNVLVSPHSASISDRENQRLTELFCENLRRYLAGEPLKNVLDHQKMY